MSINAEQQIQYLVSYEAKSEEDLRKLLEKRFKMTPSYLKSPMISLLVFKYLLIQISCFL